MKYLLISLVVFSTFLIPKSKSLLKSWVGEWVVDSNIIKIVEERKKLKIKANALYDNGQGIINEGTVEGVATPKEKELKITQDGCELTLALKDKAMIEAKDNGACGGLNVTFKGIYLRK